MSNHKQRRRLLRGLLVGLATATTIIATAANAYLVYTNSRFAEEMAKVQTFNNLRSRFFEIQDRLPGDVKLRSEAPQRGTHDWKVMRAYWEQSFNEWFTVTHLLEGRPTELWNEYYRSVFKCVIRLPAYSGVFYELQVEEFSNGPRGEFFHVIDKLAKEPVGKNECGSSKIVFVQ